MWYKTVKDNITRLYNYESRFAQPKGEKLPDFEHAAKAIYENTEPDMSISPQLAYGEELPWQVTSSLYPEISWGFSTVKEADAFAKTLKFSPVTYITRFKAKPRWTFEEYSPTQAAFRKMLSGEEVHTPPEVPDNVITVVLNEPGQKNPRFIKDPNGPFTVQLPSGIVLAHKQTRYKAEALARRLVGHEELWIIENVV